MFSFPHMTLVLSTLFCFLLGAHVEARKSEIGYMTQWYIGRGDSKNKVEKKVNSKDTGRECSVSGVTGMKTQRDGEMRG